MCYEKYHGLSTIVGKSITRAFQGIEERIWGQINSLKEKFISQVRKEILIKAVIKAIPTYNMNVFQLPKALCHEIISLMLKFWEGSKENDKKTVWMSWAKLEKSKSIRDWDSEN
jgi:hypothetical protein